MTPGRATPRGQRRRGLALATALVPSLVGAAPARAEATPPCFARVSLSTARAYVGQQIEHHLRLLRRTDVSATAWLEAPVFQGFRVETLPGGFASERETIGDRYYIVYEERRALFALEPGRLTISPARIECRLHAVGSFAGESVAVPVPGASVDVAALPRPPPGFTGLVGPVAAELRVEPREIALGASVRAVATVVGEGNLWEAAPPFSASEPPDDAELFVEPPRLELVPGARLQLRRTFVYDVVPRRSGLLALGPWAVPYFDPASGRYAAARTDAPTVLVAEAPAPRPEAPPTPAGNAVPALPPDGGDPALALLAGALLVAGAVLLLRALRRPAAAGALPAARAASALRDALAAADAAARDGDPGREARSLALALRLAIEGHLASRAGAAISPGTAHARTAEELAARAGADPDAAAAAALLLELEAARFAPGAVAPGRERLHEALARLARSGA